jgi:hypothetical protein
MSERRSAHTGLVNSQNLSGGLCHEKRNSQEILKAGGADLKDIVQATIQVAGLWGGMLVEMVTIAMISESPVESEPAPLGPM